MNIAEKFQTVLVTGANGFVGASMVRRLLRRGHDVHVVVRDASRAWRLDDLLEELVVHEADIVDEHVVRDLLEAVRPTVVCHFATHGAYEHQNDAATILKTTVLATHHLLDASRSAGARLFVNAGSSSEYGFKMDPMSEESVLEPNSVYAVGKAAQTHLCCLAGRRQGLCAVTFRFFSLYGPWEDPGRLMPTLIRRARAGQPLVLADPNTARDFLYIDDALEALADFERLLEFPGEIFNLGTGNQSTLREVVSIVQRLLGNQSPVNWGSMPGRAWDTDRWCAEPTRARQMLGWLPRTSLPRGLARFADWMAAQGDDYGPQRRPIRPARAHGQDDAALDRRAVA